MDKAILLFGLLAAAVAGLSYVIAFQIVEAYDSPPVVDPSSTTARSNVEQKVYRFGPSVDKPVTYSDGTVVPSRTFSIQELNQTTQQWHVIGYANTHLHKVKVDSTDVIDISVGSTARINPKN